MQTPTTFPNLPAQVPNINPAMVFHQHAPPAAAAQAPKRRRTDEGAVAMLPDPTVFLNGEQLAAAAAQALSQGRGRKKSQAQIDRRFAAVDARLDGMDTAIKELGEKLDHRFSWQTAATAIVGLLVLFGDPLRSLFGG